MRVKSDPLACQRAGGVRPWLQRHLFNSDGWVALILCAFIGALSVVALQALAQPSPTEMSKVLESMGVPLWLRWLALGAFLMGFAACGLIYGYNLLKVKRQIELPPGMVSETTMREEIKAIASNLGPIHSHIATAADRDALLTRQLEGIIGEVEKLAQQVSALAVAAVSHRQLATDISVLRQEVTLIRTAVAGIAPKVEAHERAIRDIQGFLKASGLVPREANEAASA